MNIFCGIDPGLTGALAFLNTKTSTLAVYDMPVVKVTTGDSTRSRLVPEKLRDLFDQEAPDTALIEKVHSTPNDGHVGAFTFGKATGLVIGCMVGMDIPFDETTPGKWKKDLRVPADKEMAVHVASRLFPKCRGLWTRKKDHGRAEAALIALYLAVKNGFVPSQPILPRITDV